MASNRLPLIPGTTASFVIDLIDPTTAKPLPTRRLLNANAQLRVRTDPTLSDVLHFQTPDPIHLVLDAFASTLTISFTGADTDMLVVGDPYFYQIELDLADGEIKIPIDWTPVDVTLGGSSATPPPVFASTVKIDHNYNMPDALAYITPGGSPIDGAQVRLYLKSDYDCGRLSSPVGVTTTNAHGQWNNAILVAPGLSYVVRFEKAYAFGPNIVTIVALSNGQ